MAKQDWSYAFGMLMLHTCDFLWNSGLAARWQLFRKTSGFLNENAMKIYLKKSEEEKETIERKAIVKARLKQIKDKIDWATNWNQVGFWISHFLCDYIAELEERIAALERQVEEREEEQK